MPVKEKRLKTKKEVYWSIEGTREIEEMKDTGRNCKGREREGRGREGRRVRKEREGERETRQER